MSNKKLSKTLVEKVSVLGSDKVSVLGSEITVKPTTNLNNIAAILEVLDTRKSEPTIEMVELLGRSGVTVKNACSLLKKGFDFFTLNPIMDEAFQRGRANLGSRVRSKLIEAALENNNIQSAIHLDKIYSADAPATEVNINVGSQLSTVSDDDLMKVAFTVEDGEDLEVLHNSHSGDSEAVEGFDGGEGFDTAMPTVDKGSVGGETLVGETLGGGGNTSGE